MPAPHPRMHGITHVPGGPDPVPGLLPSQASNYPAQIFQFPELRGYWRLGEGAPPYADTSGYSPGSPENLTANAGTSGDTPLTADVDPGLLPADSDDGAVGFNEEGADAGAPTHPFLDVIDPSLYTHFDFSAATPAFSVVARVQPAAASGSFWGGVVTGAREATGMAHPSGWALQMRFPTLEVEFWRATGTAAEVGATTPPLAAGQTYTLAASYDGAGSRVYVNGVLRASVADTASIPAPTSQTNIRIGGFDYGAPSLGYWRPFLGVIDEVAVYAAALSDADMLAIHEAATGAGGGPGSIVVVGDDGTPTWLPPGGDGTVLGTGPDGAPAWVPPPAPAVTVNGSSEPAAKTPRPTPPAPPAPDTDPAGVLIIDQPFTYNGATFTVQPRVWTTIPFTTPLMERMSDKTGVSAWAEIDVDDPDAAGWLDSSSPHTIQIPHDMPFLAEAMGQICLRIDNPIVEGATTHRALRIFETTRQKTLIQVDSEQADGAGAEGGMTDVFRGPGITVFASGDTGSTGSHPDIMFLPNYGLAFYPIGYDWLPYIDGVQSLRAGMRLVAQCWHDASVPLTFSCAPGTTYKPHFVLNADCDTAWGPPWSTWY